MILTKTNEDIRLIRTAFREFYFKRGNKVEEPSKIQNREFGLMGFNGAMRRHLKFSSLGGLIASLVFETPSDAFVSNAEYDFPFLPINEKGWRGADLIFDIDLKDLDLKCAESHSYSTCISCRSSYTSGPIENCPKCGSNSFAGSTLPCGKCIRGLKNEVLKLHHFLTSDIGIDPEVINTYFSGNNGFHVHVLDGSFYELNSQARADLAAYIMGEGILTDVIGAIKGSRNDFRIRFPVGGLDYGWRKRISDRLGISISSQRKVTNIIRELGGLEQFRKRLSEITSEMGVKIDAQVTTDIHRVFRVPGTLNGKSGLTKIRCVDINSFDPFDASCQLSSREIVIKITLPKLKVRLRGETFDLADQPGRVPMFTGVYLISKGLAHVVHSDP
ncbi:MAG TPA: DNA primase small subunit domain-containing protein [Nitrososphaeraceae archaeon]|nr:DNA primase small subunit domain-containing protein [Nitrososphaeraceae archaeon]